MAKKTKQNPIRKVISQKAARKIKKKRKKNLPFMSLKKPLSYKLLQIRKTSITP